MIIIVSWRNGTIKEQIDMDNGSGSTSKWVAGTDRARDKEYEIKLFL
ncbi:hypothetical protein P5G61_15235 [Paenibacillus sp. F6_3S_P_1C]|jgi:hypothetical protein|uniref:Uncharacterized protein n=1 Tax=Paenibacillus vandeheii TaxID=3035917 RepID=A0ABT8JBV7_9BACL|nr:hypothetical protein [Paenibacillus vandeheii]